MDLLSESLYTINDTAESELIPPNLSTETFDQIKAKDILPDPIATEIDGITSEIVNDIVNEHLTEQLSKLIKTMMSYQPITLLEYQWYVNCTACIILLQDFPAEILAEQHTIIRYTFNSPNELLHYCPLRMHCIAKSLNALFGTAYNLLYFVRKVCYLNRFTHHVSMSLLYGAMCRLANEPMAMFQMVNIETVLSICKAIDLATLNKDNIENLLQFLLVLAQYLVLFRREAVATWKPPTNNVQRSARDAVVVKELIEHIELIERTVEKLYRQQASNTKCLEIIEIIQFDLMMVAQFDKR